MALILIFLFLVGVYCVQPNILSQVRSIIVASIANFIADILEHDRVQAAAASAIVKGMNATSEQPDLADRLSTIYVKLQSQEDVSRQLGEQFPKVAGAFLAGAAAGLRKKEQKPQVVVVKKGEITEKKETPATSQLGQWGMLFRGGNAEKKANTTDENSDKLAAGLFPLISISSFQSCGSDHLIESDKDSVTNGSAVDSINATEQVTTWT